MEHEMEDIAMEEVLIEAELLEGNDQDGDSDEPDAWDAIVAAGADGYNAEEDVAGLFD